MDSRQRAHRVLANRRCRGGESGHMAVLWINTFVWPRHLHMFIAVHRAHAMLLDGAYHILA
jgi:hypothetical protein